MSYIPISVDDYVKAYTKTHPSVDKKVLLIKLETALDDFKSGKKCDCGSDIWVVGTATKKHGCFRCITGKAHPAGQFEIETALGKRDKSGRRHIDEMDPRKIAGMFDDEGYEIIPNHIKKPALCILCTKNYNPGIEDDLLCNLTRFDQKNNEIFNCHTFEKMKTY